MKRKAADLSLRMVGWRVEGEAPPHQHCVLIAAPHTSNVDFPLMMAISLKLGMRISWMGKHTLFEPPFGPLMLRLGGVPIERSKRHNLVQQMADRLRPEAPPFTLVIPAEGTRAFTTHWKSGFYHIAREANVPIVLAYLDYARKVGGIGPSIYPTGDVRADMAKIRAFYETKGALRADRFGPIRLREEDAADESSK